MEKKAVQFCQVNSEKGDKRNWLEAILCYNFVEDEAAILYVGMGREFSGPRAFDRLDETRSNIIFRWAVSAFLCPFKSVSCKPCVFVFCCDDFSWCKNAVLGHYSKLCKKLHAGPVQLNRQRNTKPAHLSMILDLVSDSLAFGLSFFFCPRAGSTLICPHIKYG